MNRSPVAEVRDLTVKIVDKNVIDGVSFHLSRGKITALVGESASGKTLTALSFLDLLPFSAERTRGEILLQGENVFSLGKERKRQVRGGRIAMVFQEPFSSLNPLLKVGVQVEETIIAHCFDPRKKLSIFIEDLLEMVKLPKHVAKSYPHELSGGMRQRVLLAIALSCDPEILILDEPTTALDVFTQKEIMDLIISIQKERDFASLFITHDFSVVNMIADEVLVMRNGKLLEKGAKDKVLQHPEHEYTRHLLDCVPRLGDTRDRLPTVRFDKEKDHGKHS